MRPKTYESLQSHSRLLWNPYLALPRSQTRSDNSASGNSRLALTSPSRAAALMQFLCRLDLCSALSHFRSPTPFARHPALSSSSPCSLPPAFPSLPSLLPCTCFPDEVKDLPSISSACQEAIPVADTMESSVFFP